MSAFSTEYLPRIYIALNTEAGIRQQLAAPDEIVLNCAALDERKISQGPCAHGNWRPTMVAGIAACTWLVLGGAGNQTQDLPVVYFVYS